MTIFNIQNPLTPVQQHVLTENQMLTQVFKGFVLAYKRSFDAFWRHPTLTPQEINDAWGTEALKLFQRSAATRDYIVLVDPTALTSDYIDPPLPFAPEVVDGAYTGRIIIG
jgi:hypothetical protein